MVGPSAETAALGRLIGKDVKAAFAQLPRSQQYVLYLADIEGYAYKEIARCTGTPVNTVGSRLLRARRRLRTLLDGEQPGAASTASADISHQQPLAHILEGPSCPRHRPVTPR